MKITTSHAYFEHSWGDCPVLDECNRVYCQKHRLLFRECETALMGHQGDRDVVNGIASIVEVTGDCPKCQREERMKRYAKMTLLFLALAVPASAWEKPKNPDRFPSFGLEVYKGQEAGILRKGVNDHQTNGGTAGGKLDVRLPISSALTLNFFGESTGINNNLEYTDGYRIGFGLRVYIQD